MRTLTPAAQALLGKRLAMTLLLELQLSVTLRLCTAPIDIEHGLVTYIGGRMVAIDPVKNQGGEVQGLKFSLSGVLSEHIALALAEPVQGKVVLLSVALMDPDTQAIVDVQQIFSGTIDQMPIVHGAQSATVSVTVEHRGLVFGRAKPINYSDADQQRLYPGDRSLEFLISQATHQDVWPAASFFRQ